VHARRVPQLLVDRVQRRMQHELVQILRPFLCAQSRGPRSTSGRESRRLAAIPQIGRENLSTVPVSLEGRVSCRRSS
jgi:hypothetical protein